MTLKICVAQLNLVVGDLPGNSQKIIQAARAAYADGVAKHCHGDTKRTAALYERAHSLLSLL